MKKLTIIFGVGRNGSTLFSRLIDGNPDIYMHPVESNFFAAINDIVEFGYVKNATHLNVSDRPLKYLDTKVSLTKLIDYYSFHEEEIKKDYISRVDGEYNYGLYWKDYLTSRCSEKITPAEFLQEFLCAFSKWLNPKKDFKYYCFKTIEVQYIEDYRKHCSEARFLHIIRHPIGFFNSQKRTMEKNKALPRYYFSGDDLYSMIQKRWIVHAQYIASIDGEVRTNDYVIKYEDLISDADNVLLGVMSFCHVSLHKDYCKQTILNGYSPKSLPVNPSSYGVETPIEITADLQKKSKSVLSNKEENYIYFFCNHLLGFLAYSQKTDVNINIFDLLKMDDGEFVHVKNTKEIYKAFIFFFVRRFLYIREYLKFKKGDV